MRTVSSARSRTDSSATIAVAAPVRSMKSKGTRQQFAAEFPAFHENGVPRLQAGPCLRGMHQSVPFLLCRIDIGVVMHHLPSLPLPTIDVGDAVLKGHMLSCGNQFPNLAP